jgi:hypothetical protein
MDCGEDEQRVPEDAQVADIGNGLRRRRHQSTTRLIVWCDKLKLTPMIYGTEKNRNKG